MEKLTMVKLTNEYIFYGKTNYAKLILVKINMNELIMANIKMV
jgi:hypothetical protein